jgi:hypothetical protein
MELKRDKYGGLMPRCGGGIKNPAKESPDQYRLNHMQSKLNHLYDSASIVSSHVTKLKNLFGRDAKSWTIASRDTARLTIRNIEDTLREIREEVDGVEIGRSELK